MAQVVLREIDRPPGPDFEFAKNRESYSLSAGIALGMITLGVSLPETATGVMSLSVYFICWRRWGVRSYRGLIT